MWAEAARRTLLLAALRRPSSVFSAVRRPTPADLERMRAAYIATLTASDLDAPYAVLFVVARRPPN